jgi:hypothetical protein
MLHSRLAEEYTPGIESHIQSLSLYRKPLYSQSLFFVSPVLFEGFQHIVFAHSLTELQAARIDSHRGDK